MERCESATCVEPEYGPRLKGSTPECSAVQVTAGIDKKVAVWKQSVVATKTVQRRETTAVAQTEDTAAAKRTSSGGYAKEVARGIYNEAAFGVSISETMQRREAATCVEPENGATVKCASPGGYAKQVARGVDDELAIWREAITAVKAVQLCEIAAGAEPEDRATTAATGAATAEGSRPKQIPVSIYDETSLGPPTACRIKGGSLIAGACKHRNRK